MPRKKRSNEERERNLDQEFRLWEALASFTERFKGEGMSAADMAGRLREHLGFEITPSAVERAAKAVGVLKLIDPRSERRRSRVEAARLEKEVELLTARVAELERQLAAAQPATSVGIERSEKHTSELQSHVKIVCRLLHEKTTAYLEVTDLSH